MSISLWSIDYDNKNGVDLNVNMNSNGDKSHYHQYLTNSELEELCFGPGFSGPALERSDKKAVNTLEDILGNNQWLVRFP